jgi:hypothetical protein
MWQFVFALSLRLLPDAAAAAAPPTPKAEILEPNRAARNQ